MNYLILVRHGESRWNKNNLFTGWVDVPLSKKGIQEALANANELKKIQFDVAFTSELSRAQETLLLILAKQNRTGIFMHDKKAKNHQWYKINLNKNEIPIYSSFNLNERYYGKLQGMNKDIVRKKFGEKKVFEWRRGYSSVPPAGESLEKVYKRAVPYFNKEIMPFLKNKKNIIISAHGNSLRALIKYIENISQKNISQLELKNGKPMIYKYTNNKLIRQNIKLTYNRPIEWE